MKMSALILLCAYLTIACGCSSKCNRHREEPSLSEPLPPPVTSKPDPTNPFVSTSGTQFMLNGSPWIFTGTNLYNLALTDNGPESSIEANLASLSGYGEVVRIWGFCNGGWGSAKAIQPKVFEIEPGSLRRLDLALVAAAKHNIKLIIALVNFEPEYGGMDWYVQQVLGPGKDKELFYSDPKVKAAYKWYVSKLINRTNSVSGVKYADDPTIMAWELANEPHTTEKYELQRGKHPGDLVNEWVAEMSRFVKSIDSNHLVSNGEEGYLTVGGDAGHEWLSNGTKGVDFTRDLATPDIDFGTVHFYADHWGIGFAERNWLLDHFVIERYAIATSLGKPLVIEEFGYPPKGYEDRATTLDEVYTFANKVGIPGTLVWRLTPNPYPGDFDFGLNSQEAAVVKNQASYVTAHNPQTQKDTKQTKQQTTD